MLEQISNAIKFYAFYTNAGEGATGLTVTVDVYNPAGTEIVSAGSATALGDGVYYYSLASGSTGSEGEYIAIFKTSGTVDQKHIPALWVLGKAGIEHLDADIADCSTATALQTVDDNIDLIKSDTDAYLDAAVSSRLAASGYTAPDNAGITTIDGIVDGLKLVSDKLDTAMEIDGAVYRFTINALENSPVTTPSTDVNIVSVAGSAVSGIADFRATGFATASALTTIEGKIDIIDGNIDLVLADTSELQTNQGNWLTATGFATASDLTAIDGKIDVIDANLDLSLVDTANLMSLAEPYGDGYIFTEIALQNAPSGGGTGTDVNVISVNGVSVSGPDDFKATGFSTFDPALDTVIVGNPNDCKADLTAGRMESGGFRTIHLTRVPDYIPFTVSCSDFSGTAINPTVDSLKIYEDAGTLGTWSATILGTYDVTQFGTETGQWGVKLAKTLFTAGRYYLFEWMMTINGKSVRKTEIWFMDENDREYMWLSATGRYRA